MICALDHLVLTVRDIEASCDFYCRVLGMRREGFGEARVAAQGVEIIEGIVPSTGAVGPIDSFYFRDPDLNRVEVSAYRAAGDT